MLDAVGRRKRILREALARATPAEAGESSLVIQVGNPNDLGGLEHGRGAIAEAILELWGRKVEVSVRGGGEAVPTQAADGRQQPSDVKPAPPSTPRVAPTPQAPQRMDKKGDREERLQVYRAKDPTLDAAADLLDLELTD